MYNWNVSNRSVEFFESVLSTHTCVRSFDRNKDDILFEIERTQDRSNINVVLVNIYSVGLADVIQICHEYSDANCIVTCSRWNSYTKEAKDYGAQAKIGIFTISEFLGALNWDEPYKYIKKHDEGKSFYSNKTG